MIYKIKMSTGDDIKIDEEDLRKIRANISASLISIKQAIINPSFMVSIIPTKEDEFIIKMNVVVENEVARITGEEKVNSLTDIMNPKENLLGS